MPLISKINDLAHNDVIGEIMIFFFWTAQILLTPFYLILHVALFIKNLVRIYSKTFNKPTGQAIIITGCDTGFGYDLSLELAKLGWKVYAGCLTDKGVTSLKDHSNLIPVKMDVTKEIDINRVVDQVKKETPQGLYALINNAG